MRSPRWWQCLLVVALALAVLPISAAAEDEEDEVEPQTVRLSYLQGDVRLLRGKNQRVELKDKDWVAAQPNAALEQGIAMTTGADSRAELEFESGSVAYVAENSVLLLQELMTINGVPATRLKLLTGTATFAARLAEGEQFVLEATPDQLNLRSGSFVRADSYLDALIVTPLRKPANGLVVYRDGKVIKSEGVKSPSTPAGWNEWVTARQAAREAAMPAAMQAAGVTTPFPELLELYQQGTFFPCDPYGQCWAPLKESRFSVYDCVDGYRDLRVTTLKDVRTGKKREQTELLRTQGSYPTWLACNWGSWIGYNDSYAWVFESPTYYHGHRKPHGRDHDHDHDGGHHRHHPHPPVPPRRPPGHWVKVDGKTAFVPRHPLDEKGKPPVNLKNGMFVLPKKGDLPVYQAPANLAQRVKVLGQPPRHIREMTVAEQRHPVAPPPVTARLLGYARAQDLRANGKTAASPGIQYDYRSRQFVRHDNPAGGRSDAPIVVGRIDRTGNVIDVPHRMPVGRSEDRSSDISSTSTGGRPNAAVSGHDSRRNSNGSIQNRSDSRQEHASRSDHGSGGSARSTDSGGSHSSSSGSGSSSSSASSHSSSGSSAGGSYSSGSSPGSSYSGSNSSGSSGGASSGGHNGGRRDQ